MAELISGAEAAARYLNSGVEPHRMRRVDPVATGSRGMAGDKDRAEHPSINSLFIYRTAGAGLFKLLLTGKSFQGIDGGRHRYSAAPNAGNVSVYHEGQAGTTEISFAEYVRELGEWRHAAEKREPAPFYELEVPVLAQAINLASHEVHASRLWDETLRSAKKQLLVPVSVNPTLFSLQATQHAIQVARCEHEKERFEELYANLADSVDMTHMVIVESDGGVK